MDVLSEIQDAIEAIVCGDDVQDMESDVKDIEETKEVTKGNVKEGDTKEEDTKEETKNQPTQTVQEVNEVEIKMIAVQVFGIMFVLNEEKMEVKDYAYMFGHIDDTQELRNNHKKIINGYVEDLKITKIDDFNEKDFKEKEILLNFSSEPYIYVLNIDSKTNEPYIRKFSSFEDAHNKTVFLVFNKDIENPEDLLKDKRFLETFIQCYT